MTVFQAKTTEEGKTSLNHPNFLFQLSGAYCQELSLPLRGVARIQNAGHGPLGFRRLQLPTWVTLGAGCRIWHFVRTVAPSRRVGVELCLHACRAQGELDLSNDKLRPRRMTPTLLFPIILMNRECTTQDPHISAPARFKARAQSHAPVQSSEEPRRTLRIKSFLHCKPVSPKGRNSRPPNP